MSSNKGSIILLTIIAVATLLVAVAGTTFAYFGATMGGVESGTTIEVTSGTLSIEYNGNSVLKGQNFNKDDKLSRSFTVTGVLTGSTNLNYEANLVVKANSYQDGELVYTITSKNVSNNGSTIVSTSKPVAIPSGKSTILLGKGLFAGPSTTGSKHTYTVTIYYNGENHLETSTNNFDSYITVSQTKK